MPKLGLKCLPLLMACGAIMGSVGPAVAQAEGDRALGEYLSSECVSCHKLTGPSDGIPSIVGRPAAHLITLLTAYRDKKRENPIMQMTASRLSDEEIAALAAYFASLKATAQGR